MNPKLSIIIPCYNSESTLDEAVASCFRQGLAADVEIVMVDDGSTDGTRIVMEKWKAAHPEIKLVIHAKNQGGGAARNTAVAHASGEIIFCLDGDDILPDNTLPRMIAFLEKTKSDGILFEETHFFSGTDSKKYQIVKNMIIDRAIVFADLFRKDQGFLTKVNFMYTKKAFAEAGGYPTHHGFDTQTFGIRFLAKGLSARVCPGAAYLHRRQNGPSYFIREYASGKLSFNNYLILEEVLYLFSDTVKEEIVRYDIFRNNELGGKNIEGYLQSLFESRGEKDFFIPRYTEYLHTSGEKKYVDEIMTRTKPVDMFTRALWAYRNKDFVKAYGLYAEIADYYSASTICLTNMLRCYMDDNEVYEVMYMPPGTMDRLFGIVKKISNRIKKII